MVKILMNFIQSQIKFGFALFLGLVGTFITFFRSLRLGLKKKKRKLLKFINTVFFQCLTYFGISHSAVLDTLFFGSIGLLVCRLFFRLFFSLNPFWYFNFCFFILSCLIQFKYNALSYVREFFVKILKVLLGKNYWYVLTKDDIMKFIIANGLGEPLPIINIYDRTFFNFIFQKVFVFLILFLTCF